MNAWERYKESLRQQNINTGVANTSDSFNAWQRYKADINGGVLPEEKPLKKKYRYDFAEQPYSPSAELLEWGDSYIDKSIPHDLAQPVQQTQPLQQTQPEPSPLMTMEDLDPMSVYKRMDDPRNRSAQPQVVQDNLKALENEKKAQRLAELESIKMGEKKQGEAQSYQDAFSALSEETQKAATDWQKAQQSGKLDDIEEASERLMKSVGGDQKAYDEALSAAGSIHQFDVNKDREFNFMTDDQTYEYMSLKLDLLDDAQKEALKKVTEATSKSFNADMQANVGRAGHEQALAKRMVKEGREELSASGMSDEDIDKYVEYAQRLQNRRSTEAYIASKGLDANPDQNYDTDWKKATGKLASNSAYALGTFIPAGVLATQGAAKELANTWTLNKAFKDPAGLGVRDRYSSNKAFANAGEYAQNVVSNDVIGSNHPVGQFAYGAGMSTLEAGEVAALGAMGVPSALTMLPYFGSSYNSAYNEARDRGVSPERAQMVGLASGMAEAFTEKVSLDSLVDKMAKQGAKWTKNSMKMLLLRLA